MPLDPRQRARIEAEATKRGADPKAAIAHAEKLAASRDKAKPDKSPAGDADASAAPSSEKPILVGFAPFVKVREVRAYMGLTERIPDDDMMCGAFAAKYSGAGSPAPSPRAEDPA